MLAGPLYRSGNPSEALLTFCMSCNRSLLIFRTKIFQTVCSERAALHRDWMNAKRVLGAKELARMLLDANKELAEMLSEPCCLKLVGDIQLAVYPMACDVNRWKQEIFQAVLRVLRGLKLRLHGRMFESYSEVRDV